LFQDLDSTLNAIVEDPGAPGLLREADASFETPDRDYAPSQTTLNLFLHEVSENRDLRDPEPILTFEQGAYKRRPPPLRIDCRYLVTAWSTKSGAQRAAEEHQLLGQSLAWLSRFGTIPETYLRGALAGQPYPPPTLIAQVDGRHATSEFWSALGIAPRVAYRVVVTIALDLELETIVGPEVVARELRLGERPAGLESTFAIGGTVRDASSKALIVDATVRVEPLARGARTDALGRYRFDRLKAGRYTLVTSAEGFAVQSLAVEVPGRTPNAYDIELTAA
jgi:Pvc16 N-terminal domain/Carboxypeptidase regulatory-like domain